MFLIATLWFFTTFEFAFVEDANATSGAFRFTKHGGDSSIDNGDWCPTPPCGVDREISGTGPHFASNAEAGKWQKGECMHCHEPHASFGRVEPAPNTGNNAGPADFLLFREYGTGTNYANLCWSCHNNMLLGLSPPPPGEIGYGFWGYYQGETNFLASGHGSNTTDFVYPGPQPGDTTELAGTVSYPRRNRGTIGPAGNAGSCLNCHSPHGVGDGSYEGDISGTAVDDTNYAVATDTELDAAIAAGDLANKVIPRLAIAWEEGLCLRCHDGGVANAPNIKVQADYLLVAPTDDDGSGHPIRSAELFGRHNLAKESQNKLPTAGWFVENTFHSECTDCHNPHRVSDDDGAGGDGTVMQRSGGAVAWQTNRYDTPLVSSSSPVKLGAANQGVWGVEIDTAPGGFTVTNTIRNLTTNHRLYNLCMKCHSAWAWGEAKGVPAPIGDPNTPMIAPSTDGRAGKAITFSSILTPRSGATTNGLPLTDLLSEFDTANSAYHPVFAKGKNRPETLNIRNPFWCAGYTSSVYAPVDNCLPANGSRVDLINQVETIDGTPIEMEQTLSQTFVPPWRHTSMITCVDCHEDSSETTARGPHGSTQPFILRRADTTITYDVCDQDSDLDTACEQGGSSNSTTISYAGIPAIEQTTFCFNCHRYDVYHAIFAGAAYGKNCKDLSDKASCNTNGDNHGILSRQLHPVMEDASDSGLANSVLTPNTTRGVSCMGCHGGGCGVQTENPAANCTIANGAKLGNIHGSNYTAQVQDGGLPSGTSNRLIAPGGNWESFRKSTLALNGRCNPISTSNFTTSGGGWSGCGGGARNSDFDIGATYDY